MKTFKPKQFLIRHAYILFSCYLLISVNTSCQNGNTYVPAIRDSLHLSEDAYPRMLQAYKDEELTNDAILLGFRIGMSAAELRDHLKELIAKGTIVRQDDKLYGLIPTNEFCSTDKDNKHQYVAELVFHIDVTSQVLNAIYATLYGPRFLTLPFTKRAMIDYTPTVDEIWNKAAETQVTNEDVSCLMSFTDKLLDTYRLKYGSENHIISNAMDETNYIWITGGRMIEVELRNDFSKLCWEYASTDIPESKEDFTRMVLLGSLTYTTIPYATKLEEGSRELAPVLQNLMDSMYNKQKEQEEQRVREEVNNSGI